MPVDFPELINHLSHSIIITDAQCKVVYLSPAAEALLAISSRKAQRFDLASLPTGSGKNFGSYLNKTLQDGQSFTHRELIIELPDQRRSITVDCTLSIIQDSQLLIELSSLDRILRIAKEDQLITQQQASREVVRGMAHEIKNPLGGIRGAAQLLERELDKAQKDFTQIIISEVDRLQNLVDRMLGPNRLPNKTMHNIHDILEHVIRLVDVETNSALSFKRDYDPSLPELMTDKDQLIQAILNIVRNAWEALGEGGEITIKTRAMRRFTIGYNNHRLVLAIYIIDNGPGIPDELIEQIFYPMVTGRSDGTGLGLPIAQGLINQHQGLIECDSQPGKTQFTIYLPITAEDAP